MEYIKEAQQLIDKSTGKGIYPIARASDLKNEDGTPYVLPAQLKVSGTDTSTNILGFTSNKGIYVGTDNGHWYYWNGSAYADGGVYQATELADGSVTPNKTSFLVPGNNLFNKDSSNIILGKYLDRSSGVELDNAQYYISDYIQVAPSTNYIFNIPNIFSLIYYNSNKEIIQDFINDAVTGPFTTPSNCKYVRFSDMQSSMNALQLQKGSVSTEYEPFKYYLSSDIGLNINSNDIPDNTITYNKVNFLDVIKNYINPAEIQANKYWNDLGQMMPGSNCSASPVVKLQPNTTYYIYKAITYTAFAWLASSPNETSDTIQITIDNDSFTTDDTHIYAKITWVDVPSKPYLQDSLDYGILSYDNPKLILKGPSDDNNIIYVGPTRDIKTLRQGMDVANSQRNAIVYVDKGIYDLTQEFADILETTNSVKGLYLKNNVRVIGTSGTIVKFNYTGNNDYIKTEFSPFNTDVYGGSLENITIECSNCRYCVHDERGGTTDRYHNRYINCSFSIDNSQNTPWSYQNITIGGGIGLDGLIEIDKCYFNHYAYYHQNFDTAQTQSIAHIYFTNNYMDNEDGHFVFTGGFGSVNNSLLYACGNSVTQAFQTTSMQTNITAICFNNEVRN